MKHVLFVCTANTFRSASAEYLLKEVLREHDDVSIVVSSAGTKGSHYGGPYSETIERVRMYGGNMDAHQSRKLSQAIVDDADVIVCMTKHHKKFVEDNFSKKAYLFNELSLGQETDLKDDDEAYGEYESLSDFIHLTVDTIYEQMPALYDAIKSRDL